MTNITDEEIKKACSLWHHRYKYAQIDYELEPYLKIEKEKQKFDPRFTNSRDKNSAKETWIKKAREALFLSNETVAKKMKISRAAFSRMENAEATGSITLKSLSAIAEAMDCELVYAIRPKNKQTFAKQIWDQLIHDALKHPWLRVCDQKKRNLALLAVVKWLIDDPKYRQKKGWSKRRLR
jgi:transcriptional regulator with XRE-family HTH domain